MELIGKILDSALQLPPSELSSPKDAGTLAITKFELSVETTVMMGGASAGTGAGRAQFNPVILTRPVGAASPLLMLALTRGRQLEALSITVNQVSTTRTKSRSTAKKTTTRKTRKPIQIYTFETVVISSIKQYTDADGQFMEEVQFHFRNFQSEHIQSKTKAVFGVK